MLEYPELIVVVDDCHWKLIAPVPAAPLEKIISLGSPPEHKVWLSMIVGAVTLFTVTVNTLEIAVHKTPFKVLVAINW